MNYCYIVEEQKKLTEKLCYFEYDKLQIKKSLEPNDSKDYIHWSWQGDLNTRPLVVRKVV